jgi:hypothetical protein
MVGCEGCIGGVNETIPKVERFTRPKSLLSFADPLETPEVLRQNTNAGLFIKVSTENPVVPEDGIE